MTAFLHSAPFAYALALAMSKAAGFLMLPLVTRALPVADYAQLEVLASIADVAGMLAGLGLAEAWYRLATRPDAPPDLAGRLLGSAILMAGLLLLLALSGLTLAHSLGLSIPAALWPLTISVILTATIELPFGRLRQEGRPWSYVRLFVLRTILQCGFGLGFLWLGWGVTGLFLGTALADVTIATLLIQDRIRRDGLLWPGPWLAPALAYGVPLALGGLAGFALGSLDRWFLVHQVSAADLARYGLAVKFATLVAVAIQPFGLWWYPQRLAVLARSDGRAATGRFVGIGLAMLWSAAAGIAILAPPVLMLLVPAEYHDATRWIPWLVLCAALHETASLINVGCYTGRHGTRPMVVNWVGAAIALALYALTIPTLGVMGAILATACAHLARIVLFLAWGRWAAPVRYPCATLLPALAALILTLPGFAWSWLGLIGPALTLALLVHKERAHAH